MPIDRGGRRRRSKADVQGNEPSHCRRTPSRPRRVILPGSTDAPFWIGKLPNDPDSANLIALRNGILDLAAIAAGREKVLLPPSPRLFAQSALPFRYDPHAPAPRGWLKFLNELWQDDSESIRALQQWFGLLLTSDTRFQKVLFVVGPKRSGKGTIGRVLRELLGPGNIAGPTLGSLSTNFGLSPLLGKPCAIISDARLSGRTDQAVIVERLLSISGEDGQLVIGSFVTPSR